MKAALVLAAFFIWAVRELMAMYRKADATYDLGAVLFDDADRTLFAELTDGGQVVRYDGGEWWLEYPYNPFRSGRSVSINGAVALASSAGTTVYGDRRGGGKFYEELRRYITEHNR